MHRSGTSAMAGCLHVLGIPIGKDLMQANAANPKGYFENMIKWGTMPIALKYKVVSVQKNKWCKSYINLSMKQPGEPLTPERNFLVVYKQMCSEHWNTLLREHQPKDRRKKR